MKRSDIEKISIFSTQSQNPPFWRSKVIWLGVLDEWSGSRVHGCVNKLIMRTHNTFCVCQEHRATCNGIFLNYRCWLSCYFFIFFPFFSFYIVINISVSLLSENGYGPMSKGAFVAAEKRVTSVTCTACCWYVCLSLFYFFVFILFYAIAKSTLSEN